MTWQVGMAANGVIAVAYLLIFLAIVVPLVRSNQLRTNPLGAATAAIFLTCAVHHGTHAVHMLLPSLVDGDDRGLAMRAAWGWPLATWDVVGAAVAVYYWSLRRSYGSMLDGAALFDDLRRREQQALELNDAVLQDLVVARMALDLDDRAKATAALDASITSASRIITDLLGKGHLNTRLVRSGPAASDLPGPAPASEPDRDVEAGGEPGADPPRPGTAGP